MGPLAKSFLGAVLLHLVCYATMGIYFGEYSDRFFIAYVDGSFCAGQAKPMFDNYGFFSIISWPIAWAYNALPQFNWYGIFAEAIMLMATTAFVWLLSAYWRSLVGHKWLTFGGLLFLLPFWCHHIVLFRTTELAAIGAGIGIFALVVTYLPAVAQHSKGLGAIRVFLLLLVSLSAFVRTESGLMSAVAFAPIVLYAIGTGEFWPSRFKIALVGLLAFGASYGFYMSGMGAAEAEFLAIRPYRYTLWDFTQNEALLTPKSAADSIKLEAAAAYFISDEEELGAEFYERVGVLPLEKSLGAIEGYFIGFGLRVERAIGLWQHLYTIQPILFWAYGMALLLAAILLGYNRRYKYLLFLLLAQFWLWAILIGVSVFMKMELRVLVPHITVALVVLTILPVLLVPHMQVALGNRVVLVFGSILLLYTALGRGNEVAQSAVNYAIGKVNIKQFKGEVQQLSDEGHILVFHSFAWQLLYADIFDVNEFAANKNFLSIDNGELNLYPEFKAAMQECCGGYTVEHLAQYLVDNKDKVVFVSDESRMDLMRRYIETVYGIPFGYKVMPSMANSILYHPAGGKMMPEHAEHFEYSYYILN